MFANCILPMNINLQTWPQLAKGIHSLRIVTELASVSLKFPSCLFSQFLSIPASPVLTPALSFVFLASCKFVPACPLAYASIRPHVISAALLRGIYMETQEIFQMWKLCGTFVLLTKQAL